MLSVKTSQVYPVHEMLPRQHSQRSSYFRTLAAQHTLYKLITLITQASRWKIFLLPWRIRTSCNGVVIPTSHCRESDSAYIYRSPVHNIGFETLVHPLHNSVSNSLHTTSIHCFMNSHTSRSPSRLSLAVCSAKEARTALRARPSPAVESAPV